MKNYLIYVSVILITACSVPNYSFNGGKVHPDAKTISIAYFENSSSLGPSNLGQTFTESLRDLFQSQTKLELINGEGNLAYEGSITNYVVQPIAIQSNQTASQNRLTITVNVSYRSEVETGKDFEQNFTRFADFNSSQNLSSVEGQLITEIFDQITQDIYNKTLGDW